MMFTTNQSDTLTTIDGCQCNNNVKEQYQACMNKVRSRMIEQLDSIYIPYLKEIVEKENCINYNENCLISA